MKTQKPCNLRPETVEAVKAAFDVQYERDTNEGGVNIRGVWEATFEGDKIVLFVGASACGEFLISTSEVDARDVDGEGEAENTVEATVIEADGGILVNFGGEEDYPLEDGLFDDWAYEALSEVESEAVQDAEDNAGSQASYRSIRYDRDFM